jgi:hypothetical protein
MSSAVIPGRKRSAGFTETGYLERLLEATSMVQLSKIAPAVRVANARRRLRDEAEVEAWRGQAYPEIRKLA